MSAAEGEKVARALVANLLSQRPVENYTNTQVVRVRADKKKTVEIPVMFSIVCTPSNFCNIYEVTGASNKLCGTTLTISHTEGQPNEYFLLETNQPDATNAAPRKLNAAELALPFAGSDFWVSDLGLEFLHWPQQRVLKKEMRQNLFCDVLESVNPDPGAGGYRRVVSWIGANRPDETVLVHADGYDTNNKLLKAFDPKKLEKINGAYQLKEMEMRNLQTRSQTRIEFNLDAK